MKRCVILFSDGTEEIEALTPLDILRRAGVECTLAKVPTATSAEGCEATGSHGIRVLCDALVSDLTDTVPDMVIVPGGLPGTTNIGADKNAEKLLKSAYESGKFIAAICAAPSVLGKLGMLEGRRATCYPGFEKELAGAVKTSERAVRDGNVITAVGMGAAVEFALECAKALCGDETAKKLSRGIMYG